MIRSQRQIVVTRPAPAGLSLCDKITKQGFAAIYFPTIEIVPTQNAEFYNQLSYLSKQDWLIFISPQAVLISAPQIKKYFGNEIKQLNVAAIGESTQKLLVAEGFLVKATPTHQWNSEGLLAMAEFQNIKNQKITLIKGEGGRTYLADQLTARGARVSLLDVYRRCVPKADIRPLIDKLKAKTITAIVCASYEAVRNLQNMIGLEGRDQLIDTPLIVVSERIKKLAHDLGFRRIWVANNATDCAILACIERNCDDRNNNN